MTEEEKSIIENQIKLISIEYSSILLDKNALYKKIGSDKTKVDNAIDLLTENNILRKIKENDNTYYSLKEKYFNDNDI